MSDLPDPSALWKSADLLRGSVDAAEYKHLVLGLLFLKYVSESFEQHREKLEAELSDPASDDYIADEDARQEQIEDRDEYQGSNVFFVPLGARWSAESDDPAKLGLLQAASLPGLGQRIDTAFELIEKENETLKGVCRRSTRGRRSPRSVSAASSRRSATSRSSRRARRATTSAGPTSTSSPASPPPRARALASSTRLSR
ncbi:type I restriction-modification system subunit M N-terminal domain-containing protein [Conexibacter sp. W3-3-2]|uniref:type I restriction-modification system subunit M N-terminal domain-containing protein n=1 Tax=Conexibacter sp. W3-3-2 TaxID=2675227 RepID=UPI0012B7676B|nr:type I restriction-modification system subunit M N-terminal domain-containing protein [Conexibacter sp. W3-3-2]